MYDVCEVQMIDLIGRQLYKETSGRRAGRPLPCSGTVQIVFEDGLVNGFKIFRFESVLNAKKITE